MIYLDNHATTACDPEVITAMLPYLLNDYGNASSNHYFGQIAYNAIQKAQLEVAQLLGGSPKEIIFTSGATESNNLALLGTANAYTKNGGKRRKFITSSIEHKSIIAPLKQLKTDGWEVEFFPINSDGKIDIDRATEIINDNVFLISIQLANSEIGTIQQLLPLTQIARQKGIIVHCDAAQAFGKTPFQVDELGVDLLSISAHKIYGPKGIGALWVNEYSSLEMQPLMFGGNPVKNVRPGTLSTPLIVGMGKACTLCHKNFEKEIEQTTFLRNYFEEILLKRIPDLKINGAIDSRLPNNSNITFPKVSADVLLSNIPEVIASTSSACESGSIEPSRTLLSIGLSREQAFNTIRFGLSRYNTQHEIETATEMIIEAWSQLV